MNGKEKKMQELVLAVRGMTGTLEIRRLGAPCTKRTIKRKEGRCKMLDIFEIWLSSSIISLAIGIIGFSIGELGRKK